MREKKRILDQWLSRLEAEKGLIEGAILEINRRLAVPGGVEEWNAADYTATDQMEHDIEVGSLNGSGSPPIRYSR